MSKTLSQAISAEMARQYEEQNVSNTKIFLSQKNSNSGGYCEKRSFKKDVLYKIMFPRPLPSLEHFVTVFITLYKENKVQHMSGDGIYPDSNHGSILIIYDEYSVDFLFFRFLQDVECSFFTNVH